MSKAPDKIFVPPRFRLVDGLRVRENDADEEYIRKDALLEWAKEQASSVEKLNGRGSMLKAYDNLIEKLNSM